MKLKHYPQYKPSGIDCVGDFPEHWKIKKLKYIGFPLIGLTYSPEDVVDEDFEGKKTLVLRASNIQNGELSYGDNVFVNSDIPKELYVRALDLLICVRSGSRHLVGKTVLIKNELTNTTFGVFMAIFRSKINRYLYHVFNSSLFKYQSTGYLTTTINQLTNNNLNNIVTPLPPADEQAQIVDFLDRETGRIDDLISKKERLIDLLKEKRTAMISHAVTKGLNPNVRLKPSGVEWLGDVPEHWSVLRSDAFLDYDREQVLPEEMIKYEKIFHYSIPVVQQEGTGREESSDEVESSKQIICQPVVLVSKLNPRKATICIAEPKGMLTVCSTEFVALIPKAVDIFYLEFLVLSEWYRQRLEARVQSVTRSHQRVNPSDIHKFWVAIPPRFEQELIVRFISKETQDIEALISKAIVAIEKLKEYRVAIISAAVTGKIDVRSSINA